MVSSEREHVGVISGDDQQGVVVARQLRRASHGRVHDGRLLERVLRQAAVVRVVNARRCNAKHRHHDPQISKEEKLPEKLGCAKHTDVFSVCCCFLVLSKKNIFNTKEGVSLAKVQHPRTRCSGPDLVQKTCAHVQGQKVPANSFREAESLGICARITRVTSA